MDSIKILFVGNSFAIDTTYFASQVAHSFGVKNVKIGTLYVGGCSIDKHFIHATEDMGVYEYYVNEGEDWECTENFKIGDAIKSDDWDWIAIQHGTKGGYRYTSLECYDKLPGLIEYIKGLAPKHTKIAFNLTWLGEPDYNHHEIISYNGDMTLMRKNLEEVTKAIIAQNPRIDILIPTGTAVENARTSKIGLLTRDGYHLSEGAGRFIAALSLISTVTGIDAEKVNWLPKNVSDYARNVAVEAVKNAQTYPFTVTRSAL